MSPQARLGQFLRDHREARNISIPNVVAEIRILSVSQLELIESGEVEPELDVIFALANVLGIEPDDLLHLFYQLAFPSVHSGSAQA